MIHAGHDGSFVLFADHLLDGTGGPPVEDPAVVVGDGRIVAVHARHDGWRPPAGVPVIQEPGSTLIPGLIDTHVHLSMSAAPTRAEVMRDFADEDPARMMAGAAQRAQRCLAAGVTTVRDCGGPDLLMPRLRDERDAGRWVGPRILAAGTPLTTTGGHLHWMGRICDSAEDLRAGVRWLVEHGADFIKIALTGGMSTPGSDPFHAQYTAEQLCPAVEEAHRGGRRVAVHVLSSAGIRVALTAAVDTIEHGWSISGIAQDFEPALAVAMAATPTFGSVTANHALRELLPSDGMPGDLAELERRLIPHRGLREAGVPLVVHSDAGGPGTRFEDFALSIEVFHRGMGGTASEAVQAASGTAASCLGLGRDLGTIEPGKLADIVVTDGNLAKDVRGLRHVRKVFMEGRLVFQLG